jgi:aminoglycoside phosphotransferase (APT) family kinase protein
MSSKLIDQPKDVRAEDALDINAVGAFVKTHYPDARGKLEIKQFRGGASNLTYQLNFENISLILRTSPKGTKAKGAHDMAREFRIMQRLKPSYPYVPQMIALCSDEALIGREFYVMEKISGIIPRANLPKELSLNESEVRTLCTNVIDKLIELHRVDIESTGLNELGKGAGYCQRQIDGWTERYKKAKTWNVPSCNYVMDYLKANVPLKEKSCFIHNDFRFDNVVLDENNPTKIIGVLDWEMATIGDPMMDLGNSLAYWVQADDDFVARQTRRQPTHLPGMLKRKEVINYYCERMGFDAKDFTFYEVYGIFRLAVIMQQIYFRYHHGQTTNKAFKNFWFLVNYMNWRCRKLI